MPRTGLQRTIGFTPQEISRLFRADIIAEHIDEVSFLWFQRDAAVDAPHYSLKDLRRLDDRVDAHLEGLEVAGDHMWHDLEGSMDGVFPGSVFAAVFLAATFGAEARLRFALQVAASKPAMARAAISGFGWLRWEVAMPVLAGLLQSGDHSIKSIAIGGFAAHRQDPGFPLIEALESDYNDLLVRAVKAVGHLGKREYGTFLLSPLAEPAQDLAFHAAHARARLGHSDYETKHVLRQTAETGGEHSRKAAEMAVRSQEGASAIAWAMAMMETAKSRRAGIAAAGATGDISVIPTLLNLMDDPKWARAAGEAFTMITGADLAKLDLEADAPSATSSGPPDNPLDEDISLDPDENLPWPAPDRVRTYWASQEFYQPGCRYLAGLPINSENLRKVLEDGRQRQRIAAAVELGLRHPDQPLFGVQSRARRQIDIMSTWTV